LVLAINSRSGASKSFEFLLGASSARSAAMAESYSAVDDDPSSGFFNPAAIAFLDKSQIQFMHVSYISDASFENALISSHRGKTRFNIALNLGRISDIQRRDDYPSQDPLGLFDEHNFAAIITMGRPINDNLALGISGKYAYEKLDLEAASAMAFDFGGFYKISEIIAASISYRNLGTKPKFYNQAYGLPAELRLGLSFRGPENTGFRNILASSDLLLPSWGDSNIKLNLGGEYNYQDLFFARLGYYLGYDSKSLALGGGIAYKVYKFDYSLNFIKNDLGDIHRFTLSVIL